MPRASTTSDPFNAVAEPRRRDILEFLAAEERSVSEIVDALELAQPLGEHVWRDSLNLLLQLSEPPRTVEQGGDQQQRPSVADGGERVGQGRAIGVVGLVGVGLVRGGLVVRGHGAIVRGPAGGVW